MKKDILNKFNWWDSLTPTEKQNQTNKFYCKFRQVFWKEVSLDDIGIMFFRFNKSKNK